MRSISMKLILAFLSIGIISVAIIFITARWNTRAEFLRFLTNENQTDIIRQLYDYHRAHGSWAGVESLFDDSGGVTDEVDRYPFALADQRGRIIIPNGKYHRGERISPFEARGGTALLEDGELIGILIPARAAFEGRPREMEFIERSNRTLLYGALIGAGIALLLGIILSRTLTRPIRELTQATHAVSQGDLSQQVPVRSDDELGELAQAFNKMSAELSRSINARKQMTADIAHELRTPLSLILGHAEAVHDGVLAPSRENFEIIREEAARLEQLVNDLRTLSLADAGELSLNPQTVDPGQLLQDVGSLYKYQLQRKAITLRLDIAPQLPPLDVDPGRITQVLTNILDNALRHTPDGGSITLSAREVEDQVKLAVQDSGPGLKTEDLERIFNRLHRADPSRQREQVSAGGSGLGLAIARSIVQAHGGQVSAESETGQGLKIVIRLPKKA
jgi:signal transduction histidine kinase